MRNEDNKILKERLEEAWSVPPMPKGSRDRFMRQLDRKRNVTPIVRLRVIAATAIAAALVGAVFFLISPKTTEEPTSLDLAIAEVKGYYKSLMWSEAEYIEQLTHYMDTQTREELMAEVRKVEAGPDSIVDVLQKEQMPEDIKIASITSVYMSHLRSLKQIHALLDDRQAYYQTQSEIKNK